MPWMNPADCIAPPDWVRHTVWYQVYPDRFCRGGSGRPGALPWRHGPVTNAERFGGDLAGIAQKLPYLAGLGVNGLYLNPIFGRPQLPQIRHHRLHPRRPGFRHRGRPAGAGAPGPCQRHPGHAGRGVQPLRPRLCPLAGCGGKRPRLRPWRDWFFVNRWPVEEGRTDDGRYFSFSFHGGMPKLNTNHPAVQGLPDRPVRGLGPPVRHRRPAL